MTIDDERDLGRPGEPGVHLSLIDAPRETRLEQRIDITAIHHALTAGFTAVDERCVTMDLSITATEKVVAAVNKKLGSVDKRFKDTDRRFKDLEHRLGGVVRGLGDIGDRLDQFDDRFDETDGNFACVNRQLAALRQAMNDITVLLTAISRRDVTRDSVLPPGPAS